MRKICEISLWVTLLLAQSSGHAADFDCVIDPRQIIELRTASPGIIASIKAKRGDKVKAGAALVEIDTSYERASADVAAHRATMTGALRTGEARLEFSEAKAARQANLAERNFVSAQDRDSAVAERKLAEAELQEAKDNRVLAALEHVRMVEQVRVRTILAPVDAVVVDRFMNPGEFAGTGESAKPILKLADLAMLHVEVLLPLEAWNRIRVGQNIEVLPGYPGAERATAKVTVIDQVLDAPSSTFGVRLELPNANLRIPAGIRCKASFPGVATATRLPSPTANGQRK